MLFQLAEAGLNFRVCVLGQSYAENPPIFTEARQRLANFISHWGYAENKEKYVGYKQKEAGTDRDTR